MINVFGLGKCCNSRIPIKSWCSNIEEGALDQIKNLAMHPVLSKHIAIMPDCHLGYGMPIGGVIACKNAIIPNAVGVDISCGVRVVKTNICCNDDLESYNKFKIHLKDIVGLIREKVPIGFNHHKNPQQNNLIMPSTIYPVMKQEKGKIDTQIATLGGGNHFIELQKGDDNYIWFMLHTGSRNLGKKICDYYNELAKKLNKLWYSEIKEEWDLAFLPIGTEEARAYIEEMKFAMLFAEENRRLISERVKESFLEFVECCFDDDIDVKHNYARIENHFDENLWIHRKGAISAKLDEIGIIPGSMGTSSYIVKGLGNRDSFTSCSHGAGRKMGRSEASKVLTEKEVDKAMEGILFGRWNKSRNGNIDLGEAPQAYKDIDEVIKDELDLIVPIRKLKPLAVIKG